MTYRLLCDFRQFANSLMWAVLYEQDCKYNNLWFCDGWVCVPLPGINEKTGHNPITADRGL